MPLTLQESGILLTKLPPAFNNCMQGSHPSFLLRDPQGRALHPGPRERQTGEKCSGHPEFSWPDSRGRGLMGWPHLQPSRAPMSTQAPPAPVLCFCGFFFSPPDPAKIESLRSREADRMRLRGAGGAGGTHTQHPGIFWPSAQIHLLQTDPQDLHLLFMWVIPPSLTSHPAAPQILRTLSIPAAPEGSQLPTQLQLAGLAVPSQTNSSEETEPLPKGWFTAP